MAHQIVRRLSLLDIGFTNHQAKISQAHRDSWLQVECIRVFPLGVKNEGLSLSAKLLAAALDPEWLLTPGQKSNLSPCQVITPCQWSFSHRVGNELAFYPFTGV